MTEKKSGQPTVATPAPTHKKRALPIKIQNRSEKIAAQLDQVPVQGQVQSGNGSPAIGGPLKTSVQSHPPDSILPAETDQPPEADSGTNPILQAFQDRQVEINQITDLLFDDWDAEEFMPQDFKLEVAIDSLESRAGYASLLRQMHHAYILSIAFYESAEGGLLSTEEARRRTFHGCRDKEKARKLLHGIARRSFEDIDFADLGELSRYSPQIAEKLWETLKKEGGREFISGHLGANVTFPVGYLKQVWNVARYLGVRECFIADWQPKGGIEVALLDMITQTYFQWQYWLEQSVKRAQTPARREHYEYHQWKQRQTKLKNTKSWDEGYWFPPYVSEQRALDQAVQTADRFNRIFLRTLRQLRDLRRYSPVTINNPNQVNIAAEGGQQINLAKPDKTKPDEKGKVRKRKLVSGDGKK